MQIRRKIMNECKGNPRLQKALAIAVYLKYKFGRSSMMQNYTINKIHKLTKISATTLKKYLPFLIKEGFVHFSGTNKQHIIISKLSSHTNNRNVCIDKFCFDSFVETYRSLRAFIFLIVQSHKDFVKRTLQIATDPTRGQDFYAARKLVKRLVKQGILHGIEKYKEFGISFKRIAEETGNCIRTAQRIVKYAIEKKWVTKNHNQIQIRVNKISYRHVSGYTFSTMNNVYAIKANTYNLCGGISHDIKHW